MIFTAGENPYFTQGLLDLLDEILEDEWDNFEYTYLISYWYDI